MAIPEYTNGMLQQMTQRTPISPDPQKTSGIHRRFLLRPTQSYMSRSQEFAGTVAWSTELEGLCDFEVIVNHAASVVERPQTDENLEALIKSCARVVTPPWTADSISRTVKDATRAIYHNSYTWQHGEIPRLKLLNSDISYGWLMSKGNGPLGKIYGATEGSVHQMGPNFNYRSDPVGFFGERDAQQEIEIANRLISSGFRAAMPLGYIAINPGELKNAMNKLWENTQHPRSDRAYKQREFIIRQIEKVETNGDRPAILVRYTGSPLRLNTAGIPNTKEGKNALKRFLDDTHADPKIISALDPHFTTCLLEKHIKQFVETQAAALTDSRILDDYPTLQIMLCVKKDIDASFVWQDFEGQGAVIDTKQTIDEWQAKMSAIFETYLGLTS